MRSAPVREHLARCRPVRCTRERRPWRSVRSQPAVTLRASAWRAACVLWSSAASAPIRVSCHTPFWAAGRTRRAASAAPSARREHRPTGGGAGRSHFSRYSVTQMSHVASPSQYERMSVQIAAARRHHARGRPAGGPRWRGLARAQALAAWIEACSFTAFVAAGWPRTQGVDLRTTTAPGDGAAVALTPEAQARRPRRLSTAHSFGAPLPERSSRDRPRAAGNSSTGTRRSAAGRERGRGNARGDPLPAVPAGNGGSGEILALRRLSAT